MHGTLTVLPTLAPPTIDGCGAPGSPGRLPENAMLAWNAVSGPTALSTWSYWNSSAVRASLSVTETRSGASVKPALPGRAAERPGLNPDGVGSALASSAECWTNARTASWICGPGGKFTRTVRPSEEIERLAAPGRLLTGVPLGRLYWKASASAPSRPRLGGVRPPTRWSNV